ncbi:MAG: DUF4411 family protein [Acidimicrobiia bacterium]
MAYLLDANVFIEAKNTYYGFDFCPGFWEWISAAHDDGRVFSIEKVGDELLALEDELAVWARRRPDGFFLKPDGPLVASLQVASSWANSGEYEPAAVTSFLQAADYYLVAHAHAHGHVVVTREVITDSVKKIKIPNACIGLGVKCMNPYEMLRSEKARFVLP